MYSVEDLIAFVSIVEEGSVTGAANTMELDPATVSRRLSKLETKLGVSLIKRSTRRMAITVEGDRFYKHAVAAIRLLRQAEQSIASAEHDRPSGSISIAGPGWLIQKLLVPELQKIAAEHSFTHELLPDDGSNTLPGRAEISFSVGPYAVASANQVCLTHNRTVLCAAPVYLQRHGNIATIEDLQSRTCIAARVNHAMTLKDAEGSTTSVNAAGKLRCEDDATLMSIALSGQGVVALNSVHAASALQAGDLVEILPGQLQQPDRNIYMHCDSIRYEMDGVASYFGAIQALFSH